MINSIGVKQEHSLSPCQEFNLHTGYPCRSLCKRTTS